MHILDPREHVFVHAITSECVMLTCEVDREDAPVHWYKDGQEVENSDLMVLENEGPHRRLLLPVAQPSDGGEFQCVTGDERAYFTVNITGRGPGRATGQGKVFPTPSFLLQLIPCLPMVCTARFSHCRKLVVPIHWSQVHESQGSPAFTSLLKTNLKRT